MYYVFSSETRFIKVRSKKSALSAAENRENSVVFQKIPGIPNPWYVYRILENGEVERDNRNFEKKEYTPDEMRDLLGQHFM